MSLKSRHMVYDDFFLPLHTDRRILFFRTDKESLKIFLRLESILRFLKRIR